MNIRTFIRTLAAAALLAVTVVTVSAEHADARPRRQPTVKEEACAVPGSAVGSSNSWEFYSPGQSILVGLTSYVCRSNGTWWNIG